MSNWIRQCHRWVSVLFVATVIVTTVAMSQPQPIIWISYTPLLPLFLLMGSGIYMFVLPYVRRWRTARG